MYIQSVVGFSCIAAGAIGREEISGGRSPASISATRQAGSSERREATTAPADPPPTTIKSNYAAMTFSRFNVLARLFPATVDLAMLPAQGPIRYRVWSTLSWISKDRD